MKSPFSLAPLVVGWRSWEARGLCPLANLRLWDSDFSRLAKLKDGACVREVREKRPISNKDLILQAEHCIRDPYLELFSL